MRQTLLSRVETCLKIHNPREGPALWPERRKEGKKGWEPHKKKRREHAAAEARLKKEIFGS